MSFHVRFPLKKTELSDFSNTVLPVIFLLIFVIPFVQPVRCSSLVLYVKAPSVLPVYDMTEYLCSIIVVRCWIDDDKLTGVPKTILSSAGRALRCGVFPGDTCASDPSQCSRTSSGCGLSSDCKSFIYTCITCVQSRSLSHSHTHSRKMGPTENPEP